MAHAGISELSFGERKCVGDRHMETEIHWISYFCFPKSVPHRD